jgi:serine/threonine protein kinase
VTSETTAPQPRSLLAPGQILDDSYTVERQLGRSGGMGHVFAAREKTLNRLVAVKVPSLPVITTPGGPARFFKEARLAAALNHPNIVKILVCRDAHHDAALRMTIGGQSITIPYVVMEYLGGGDLSEQMVPGGMPLDRVATLFDQMCAGVEFAHQFEHATSGATMRGIVHRDLKPHNICFDGIGRLVIVDFGIARLLEDTTTVGGVIGTPRYMAPEQWQPSLGIDTRTDQYALGLILYEMLTGELPFRASEPEQWMAAHIKEKPPDVRVRRPNVSMQIAAAILKALAKRKADRFHDVGELRQAVARGLEGDRSVRARTHLRAGDQLARQGRYNEAIVQYDRAITLDPTEVNAVINRGYCWYSQGLLEQALDEYTRAIRIDPANAEAYNNRGMVWKDLGAYDNAIKDFQETMELDPTHPLAPNNLRDALERKNRNP